MIATIKNNYRKLKYRALRDKTVLIYTLGKVGSSTIYEELKKISPWNNVYHCHFLSKEWLEKRLINSPHYAHNSKSAKEFFQYASAHPRQKKYIISLVREPVSRELSNFMQNPDDFVDRDMLSFSAEELKDIYLRKMSFDYTLDWFDTEFANYTSLDIYSLPFDKEKGFSIYNTKDFNLLIIKLEKLNNCYREAMSQFLGLNLQLSGNANESTGKSISTIYKTLKKSIRFPLSQLQQVYGSKYVQHFYTDEEIKKFIDIHAEKSS